MKRVILTCIFNINWLSIYIKHVIKYKEYFVGIQNLMRKAVTNQNTQQILVSAKKEVI